jgi:hypothetical protein
MSEQIGTKASPQGPPLGSASAGEARYVAAARAPAATIAVFVMTDIWLLHTSMGGAEYLTVDAGRGAAFGLVALWSWPAAAKNDE